MSAGMFTLRDWHWGLWPHPFSLLPDSL